jgi:hypothetical protein
MEISFQNTLDNAAADSGSLDSFRLFIFGALAVIGNLESVRGHHSLGLLRVTRS